MREQDNALDHTVLGMVLDSGWIIAVAAGDVDPTIRELRASSGSGRTAGVFPSRTSLGHYSVEPHAGGGRPERCTTPSGDRRGVVVTPR